MLNITNACFGKKLEIYIFLGLGFTRINKVPHPLEGITLSQQINQKLNER